MRTTNFKPTATSKDGQIHDKLAFGYLLGDIIEQINEVAVVKHKFPQHYHNAVISLYNFWNFYIYGGGEQEPDPIFVNEMRVYEERILKDMEKMRPDKKAVFMKEEYPIIMGDLYYKALVKSIGRQGMLPRRQRVLEI